MLTKANRIALHCVKVFTSWFEIFTANWAACKIEALIVRPISSIESKSAKRSSDLSTQMTVNSDRN